MHAEHNCEHDLVQKSYSTKIQLANYAGTTALRKGESVNLATGRTMRHLSLNMLPNLSHSQAIESELEPT